MSVRRILVAACAALAIVALPAGNASASIPTRLAAAKAFQRYPVYWAGKEVLGLPLGFIERQPGNESRSLGGWGFDYGSCETGAETPSCYYPLGISVYSTCKRWAAQANEPEALVPFRGAKAFLRVGSLPKPIEIFTGQVTISISVVALSLREEYGRRDARKVALTAARQLRIVSQGTPRPLEPPAPGSLTGDLPCQVEEPPEEEEP